MHCYGIVRDTMRIYMGQILYFSTVFDHSLKNWWQEIAKDNIIAVQLGQELYPELLFDRKTWIFMMLAWFLRDISVKWCITTINLCLYPSWGQLEIQNMLYNYLWSLVRSFISLLYPQFNLKIKEIDEF